MQVCKYASMPVCKYTSMQICNNVSIQEYTYSSIQVCEIRENLMHTAGKSQPYIRQIFDISQTYFGKSFAKSQNITVIFCISYITILKLLYFTTLHNTFNYFFNRPCSVSVFLALVLTLKGRFQKKERKLMEFSF